jgi:hypothetical protein
MKRRFDISQPKRVNVQELRSKLQSGAPILLVCAYPSDAMFLRAPLDRAISLGEFESRKANLPRDSEIVFY